MADRVERLTYLLALLLETSRPLSLIEIAGELAPPYPESEVARRAAFERDKASLREIGVPIDQEIVPSGQFAGQTRYWIDRDRYELRDLELEPDETRALQVAMAATRPGSASGQEALWKLGGGALDAGTAVTAVIPDAAALPAIRSALNAQRSVTFSYRGEQRHVDPWGIVLRSGFWYLVGHDRNRSGRRTFRIDRIEGTATPGDPIEASRPQDFDPSEAVPRDPKLIGTTGGEITHADVWVHADRAAAVERELGSDRVRERRPDGSVVVEVACANLPAFRSWVLGFLDDAEVLAPPGVRADLIQWLESVE
jgi:predicted DNA-binding transcriptional regulator YafY